MNSTTYPLLSLLAIPYITQTQQFLCKLISKLDEQTLDAFMYKESTTTRYCVVCFPSPAEIISKRLIFLHKFSTARKGKAHYSLGGRAIVSPNLISISIFFSLIFLQLNFYFLFMLILKDTYISPVGSTQIAFDNAFHKYVSDFIVYLILLKSILSL